MVVKAPIQDGSGYSTMARNMLLRLSKSNKFNIRVESYMGSSVQAELDQETSTLLNSMINNKTVHNEEAVMFQVSIGAQMRPDCKWNIGYSVFETDHIPFSWIPPLNKMDAVCAPCSQNAKAFADSGVTVPIHVVPHGVDSSVMNEDVEPFKMFADKRNFLFMGTPQYRKGIDLAIGTYLNAFGDSNDTRLICKVYLEASHHEAELNIVKNMIKDTRAKLGKSKGEIVVIPHFISAKDLMRLYKSVGMLLFPSRGEGWGFAGSEAAACGVPIIATNWGGPADYLNNDIAYMINYKLDYVQNMQFNPQFMLAQMEGHKWAEPDKNHLHGLMMEAYSSPLEAKAKGLRAAKHMRNNFSWDLAGDKLIKVIENVVNK